MNNEEKLKILIEAHNRASKAFDEVNSQVDKTEKKFSGLSDKLAKAGDKMKDVGGKMTTRLTLPILAGAGLAVKAFSDLNETMNKVEVSFGANASAVKEWSKGSIESMGLAQQSALDAAALFGDMGTGMGQTTAEASKMSMSLTQLGADMASFKNVSFERAQTALAGIYTGETEALKSLGIVMTQTNLEEYAAAKGIKTKLNEMSQAEKVQLRYNYVMDKTKNAQGDFARTSDGIANQTRMTSERVKQLSAEFGEKLAPAFGRLLEIGGKVLDFFGRLDAKGQTILLLGLGIVAALGPVITILGHVVTAIRAVGIAMTFLGAHPMILVIMAVIAVIAGLAFLIIKNWDTLKSWFNSFWEGVKKAFSSVVNFIKDNWQLLMILLLGPLGAFIVLVVTYWDQIKNTAIAAFEMIKNAVITVFNILKVIVLVALAIMLAPILIFAKIVMANWETIKNVAVAVFNFIKNIVVAVFNFLKVPVMFYVNLVIMQFNIMKAILLAVFNAIKAVVVAVFNVISGIVRGAANVIMSVFRSAANVVRSIWGSISGFFRSVVSGISGAFSGVVNTIKAPFRTAFNAVANLWNSTVGKLSFKAPSWVPGIGGKGFTMPRIPTMYTGVRDFAGGPAIVGDIRGQGGEIVNLPKGSDVFSNRESKNILRNLSDNKNTGSSEPTVIFNNYGTIKNENAEASNAFWDRFNRVSELATQGVPTNG